jgi:hypothetical protein
MTIPHIDADGHFIHPCSQCGKPNAVFGFGTWLCGACKGKRTCLEEITRVAMAASDARSSKAAT